MKTLIWLDDCRDPFYGDWIKEYSPIGEQCEVIWLKSFTEFCNYINQKGLPDAICFDHDLGDDMLGYSAEDEMTGYDCANWLINYCMDQNKPLPLWNIQSSNPIGKENIRSLLLNYIKFYEKGI